MDNSTELAISLCEVKKNFRDLDVIDSLSFNVCENSTTAIIGPSGCGKSTLLKLIAGLDTKYSGQIFIYKEDPSIARESGTFGFAFQNPSLLPWRTVEQNIRLPFDLDPKPDQMDMIKDSLKLVNLSDYATFYPTNLSGGMAERTGLARAIVKKPSILLLDEPFRSLDEIARGMLNNRLRDIIRFENKIISTTILVTHSIAEALFLADTVILLSNRPAHLVHRWDIPSIKLKSIEDVYSNVQISPIRTKIHNALAELYRI